MAQAASRASDSRMAVPSLAYDASRQPGQHHLADGTEHSFEYTSNFLVRQITGPSWLKYSPSRPSTMIGIRTSTHVDYGRRTLCPTLSMTPGSLGLADRTPRVAMNSNMNPTRPPSNSVSSPDGITVSYHYDGALLMQTRWGGSGYPEAWTAPMTPASG